MNEERKAEWIAALESGEFKQGKSRLRNDDDTYCCLGVACEVYRRAHPDTSRWARFEREYTNSHKEEAWFFQVDVEHRVTKELQQQKEGVPPRPVADWFGLKSLNPDLNIDGNGTSLAGQNDSGKDFATIVGPIKGHL